MTMTTTTDPTFAAGASGPASSGYRLRHVVRAERTKLVSLRSTWWTILVAVVGSLLVTFLSTSSAGHHPRSWYQGFDPTNQALSGLMVAVLAIGVLGALAITGEHASGTVRVTLAATPRRPVLVAAKVVVVGFSALVVGELLSFACFGVGQLVLAHVGAPTASPAHPAVLRAVVLSGACLALLCLVALGLGLLVRHTAGALACYVGLVFVLPLVLQRIPGHAVRYTPMSIMANTVAAVVPSSQSIGVVVGATGIVLYTLVALAVGGLALGRRDA